MDSVDIYIQRKKEKRKKEKRKKNRRRITLLLIIMLIFGFRWLKSFADLYDKISYVSDISSSDKINNFNSIVNLKNANNEKEKSEVNFTEVDGITNILLLGIDAREVDDVSRSDSILVLTIDSVHKKLKVTSIMRDTYVEIEGHGKQKINHSFAYGGASLLMNTIENNYNVKIDKYAIINFNGFKHLVDLVDGLDINVEEHQIDELNKCIRELNKENPEYITSPGLQHLTGEQVLGYSRMRHIKNDGYGRAERQREVISLLLSKVRDTSIFKYTKIAKEMFEYLKTNVEFTEALNLAYTVFKINNFEVEKLQIPANELSEGIRHPSKGWILVNDIEQNAQVLNEFIFRDIPYDKTKISISDYKEAIATYYAEKK